VTYRRIVVTRRGDLSGVEIEEVELRAPAAGEARVRALASPVCQDDVAARVGNRPVLPKLPFTPGYSILGVVDAVGDGVNDAHAGDRVVALLGTGGHAEYVYVKAAELAPVPDGLDPAAVSVLVLNYLVAWQVLHRVAKVRAGQSALLIGASGGVGTAFLQLGRLAGLSMYGLASPKKHALLAEHGCTPIDYHTQDFVEVLGAAEPDGVDLVLNGMAEAYFRRGLSVLRRGGTFVHYGGPQSLGGLVRLVAMLLFYDLWPNGKHVKGYGTHRVGHADRAADWAKLFELLGEGSIAPVVADRLPLLEAKDAYARLERGEVTGVLVLVSPELLAA